MQYVFVKVKNKNTKVKSKIKNLDEVILDKVSTCVNLFMLRKDVFTNKPE